MLQELLLQPDLSRQTGLESALHAARAGTQPTTQSALLNCARHPRCFAASHLSALSRHLGMLSAIMQRYRCNSVRKAGVQAQVLHGARVLLAANIGNAPIPAYLDLKKWEGCCFE